MEPQDVKALIKDLVSIMKESELEELEIRQEELEIHLRRAGRNTGTEKLIGMPMAQPAMAPAAAAAAPAGSSAAPAAEDTGGLVPIKSPMVGTFYQAPAPDADPFVTAGDVVDGDTVVCIVEAMKVMNEIKAETTGKIARVMVENGEAVEFGQTLFLVEPN